MGQVAPPPSLSHPPPHSSAKADADRGHPLRVVLAPNAFKGSLTAIDAADAMAVGVRAALPEAVVVIAPIADGGDGSLDAFARAGYRVHPIGTRGPTGLPVASRVAARDGDAVVELADACGMARLPGGRLAPMTSTTLGLGDAIRAALDLRPERLVVCIGGSASTDGGAGMLAALGARLLDADGDDVAPSGAMLDRVARVDLSVLDARLRSVDLVVALDVDAPLTGPRGAAVVFAPQKGAAPDQVAQLDAGLAHWGALLADACGRDVASMPGAGAAGGTGAALLALGATPRAGFDVVAALLDLDALIASADLVVTGEGRLDAQSGLGKGAGEVARRAAACGTPVLAVCGAITLDAPALRSMGFTGWTDLRSRAADGQSAMRDAPALLVEATAAAIRAWRAG